MFDFDDTFELEPDANCVSAGGSSATASTKDSPSQADAHGHDAVQPAVCPGQPRGADWHWKELPPPKIAVEVEVEIRQMFSPDFERTVASEHVGVLGVLTLINVSWPPLAVQGLAMSFADALHCAHSLCMGALVRDGQQSGLLGAFSARVWLVIKFLASFARYRFEAGARASLQLCIDLLMGPENGVLVIANEWVKAVAQAGAHDLLQLERRMRSVLEHFVSALGETHAMLTALDKVSKGAVAANLESVAQSLLSPMEVPGPAKSMDRWALTSFPMPCKLHILRLPEHLGPKVLIELRAALTDPILPQEASQIQQIFSLSCIGVVAHALSQRGHSVQHENFVEPHICLRTMVHDRFWVHSQAAATRKLLRGIDEPLGRFRPPHGVCLARSLSFRVGEKVCAFYDASQHPDGYRYVCVCKWPKAFPIVGLTSGWLPATVVGPAETDEGLVEGFGWLRVLFDGKFCDPIGLNWLLGHSAKGREDFDPQQLLAEAELVEARLLQQGQRRRLAGTYRRGLELAVPLGLVRQSEPPEPLLSVICFRWYDYWSDTGSSDYMVTNEGMITEICAGPRSLRQQLPGEYEIHTAFIKETENLEALSPAVLCGMCRGRRAVAWYFLWPVMVGKGARDAGSVGEREFFRTCQRMERSGVPSCWPHAAHLYRILCGKLWIPQMCLCRDFRVPPTVRVHYAEFQREPRGTAARALASLMRLRWTLWGRVSVPFDDFRGVVKLGFSWCGGDVLPFLGLEGLVSGLERLFEQPQCEQTVCLVQERVLDVVGEYRVLCFCDRHRGGFHKEPLWVFNCKSERHDHDVGDFTVASATAVPEAAVARALFEGDEEAQQSAEREALRLVDKWLLWFQSESVEPPQCTRIDFLATHSKTGQSEVWTCEVGECGASLCSVEVHGRNAAAVNLAMRNDTSGRFPTPLPRTMPRNGGWKS